MSGNGFIVRDMEALIKDVIKKNIKENTLILVVGTYERPLIKLTIKTLQ